MSGKCRAPLMAQVSIIMPCRDSAAHLAEALDSALRQTFRDWELLAVCDASSDGTEDILKAYAAADKRVRIFWGGSSPSGAGAARNMGLDRAGGRYVAFLDDDDVWLPEKLEKQLAYMRATGALLCATHYRTIDRDGRVLGFYGPRVLKADFDLMLGESLVGNSTMMVDFSACPDLRFKEHGGAEDYFCWMAQAAQGRDIHIMPRETVLYRLKPFSLRYRLKNALGRLRVCRELGVGNFVLLKKFIVYVFRSSAKIYHYYRSGAIRVDEFVQ